jgi:tRNA 2-thiouridine synthesizing protein E
MEMPATDLTPVLERLDALATQVSYLAERQRAQEELIAEMMPIAREAMATAIARLDVLDKEGYFAFASELAGVARRVIEGFSPGDVRQLGDSIVGILETVRAVTQPDVLDVKPIGMLGVARATRKEDVRKGLAVMLEMLRRVGKRAEATAAPAQLDRKAKLAAMLGPRRARPQLPAPARAAAPACATPAAPSTADPDWSRAKAEAIAALQQLVLTEAHWAVLEVARADFAASQVSPNIRRLTQIAGVTTKDLYALFPKAPGRTIATIAGLPKPAGCL